AGRSGASTTTVNGAQPTSERNGADPSRGAARKRPRTTSPPTSAEAAHLDSVEPAAAAPTIPAAAHAPRTSRRAGPPDVDRGPKRKIRSTSGAGHLGAPASTQPAPAPNAKASRTTGGA